MLSSYFEDRFTENIKSPGEDYKGRKVHPCRDVWILQLRSETGEVQHANAEADFVPSP